MSDDVKARRYDASRRQAQAEQTRQDVVAAAHELFLEHGYRGTTVAAVARAGGVVPETVYRGFGGKAGLFTAVVEAAVAGGFARAQVPVDDRPAIKAVIAELDPRRQIELYADTQPGIHARQGPLQRVLAGAVAVDPELADVADRMEAGRLAGMGRFAALLAERGVLRPGLSVDDARDVLWTLNSHAVHDMLVARRGWSPQRYRDWLADALAHALLAPEGDC